MCLKVAYASGHRALSGCSLTLRRVLPDYMVPKTYVFLEKMPLTSNGKVDKRALPPPGLADQRTIEYEPPKGGLESILAQIWQQLLGVPRIGRNDDFFQLGGNSLRGMALAAKVAESFQVQLPTIAVFQHPTLRAMAEAIAEMSCRGAGGAASSESILRKVCCNC